MEMEMVRVVDATPPDIAWAEGVPNEVVAFCEGTYSIGRAAHLEAMRRVRDALAPYGKFKEFCQAKGEDYDSVLDALRYAERGSRSKVPAGKVPTERQLSAPEAPEPAAQTTLDDVSPYAAQVIESWEEKARQLEKERDEAVNRLAAFVLESAAEAEQAESEEPAEVLVAPPDTKGLTQVYRDVRQDWDAARAESELHKRITNYLSAAIGHLTHGAVDTVDDRAQFLQTYADEREMHLDLASLKEAYEVLGRWIALREELAGGEAAPEPSEQPAGEAVG